MQLCHLLEADLGLSFNRKAPTYEQQRALRRFELRYLEDVPMSLEDERADNEQGDTEQCGVEEELKIDYNAFRSDYWPHFPQPLIKGLGTSRSAKKALFSSSHQLDPALVWSEFLGVICGSEASLDAPNGYIDRETYKQLSHRTRATFANRRSVVYDLFEAYLKRKRKLRTYDVADRRVIADHRSLFVLTSLTGPVLFYKRYKLAASLDLVSTSCSY